MTARRNGAGEARRIGDAMKLVFGGIASSREINIIAAPSRLRRNSRLSARHINKPILLAKIISR